MPALGRMNVDLLAMEFAPRPMQAVSTSSNTSRKTSGLGLGVIDHTDQHVEIPEEVVARVEAAMEPVPREIITLNPDCGFAPSSLNPVDFEEAYLKLRVLRGGAGVLREKYS